MIFGVSESRVDISDDRLKEHEILLTSFISDIFFPAETVFAPIDLAISPTWLDGFFLIISETVKMYACLPCFDGLQRKPMQQRPIFR